MTTQLRFTLCALFALAASLPSFAQRPSRPSDLDDALAVKLALVARATTDSVVLRWAPSNPSVWLAGAKVGYRIERAAVGRDGKPGAFAALLDSAVRPWPIERWIAFAETHPTRPDSTNYPAIAFTLLDQFGSDGPARESYSSDEMTSIAERKAELDMRYGFAMYAVDRDAGAADGLGLRFVDRSVSPRTSYVYRVYLAGSAGTYRPDTGSVNVTTVPREELPRTPSIAAGGERQVLLRWRANRQYGSYFVERSEDDGRTFTRLNTIPLATLRPSLPTELDEEIFLDTTAINYRPYVYRIYGTTPFADLDLIAETRGSARDATAPAKPFLPNPQHIAERDVRVTWMPGEPAAGDLAGFRVLRGVSDTGAFVSLTPGLLPPTTTELVDSRFSLDSPNYYVVEAVDTAGNAVRSNSAYVALIDSTPPSAPRWIAGRMDTNGVVTITLHANRERDLMGYRLFRANAADHEFVIAQESFADTLMEHARDTVFSDTVVVRTLTNHVYYHITALDDNFNESPFSTVLAVKRPDVVRPVTPVVLEVGVTDTSVALLFARSPSADLAYTIVYRRADEAAPWDSVGRVSAPDSMFTDTAVTKTVAYQYALEAIDSSALRSDLSMPVVGRPYNSGVLPPVRRLAARHNRERHAVDLEWEYADPGEEHWFVVYRADESGALRQYARVASSERRLVDARPSGGATATYAVRAVGSSGAESVELIPVQVALGD